MSAVLQTWYRGRAGAGAHAARSRGLCFTTADTASFIIAVQDTSPRIPPRIGGAADSGHRTGAVDAGRQVQPVWLLF